MVSLALAAALGLGGCADYEEDYGYVMTLGDHVVVSGLRAGADSYSVDLQYQYRVDVGQADVLEAGFVYALPDGTECTLQAVAEDGLMQATATGLLYGTSYEVYPYIRTPEGTQMPNAVANIHYLAASFAPSLSSPVFSMPEAGRMEVALPYTLADDTHAVDEATLSIGGQTYDMASADGYLSVVLDLASLPEGSYTSVDVEASNAFGADRLQAEIDLTVSAATSQYPDDGERDDCIRLCGIDWAKGNLQYEDGVWQIADSQSSTFDAAVGADPSRVEHFTYGDTSPMLHTDIVRQWYTYALVETISPVSISGDPAEDVVAAHIEGGWVLPSTQALRALATEASCQYAWVEVGGSMVYGYLFYTPGSKRVCSSTPVRLDEASLDRCGLFLPASGFYNRMSEAFWNRGRDLCYMGGSASAYGKDGVNMLTTDARVACLFTYREGQRANAHPYPIVTSFLYGPAEQAYASRFQYAVRPVKGEVIEDDSDHPLQVTQGEYIDLGLSVRWASCNVGADSPEDAGSIYTVTNVPSFAGVEGRMPSDAEIEELLTQCEWVWGLLDGVRGCQVVGPNGNSIFLPASAIEGEVGLYFVGSWGVNHDFFGFSRKSRGTTTCDEYDYYTYGCSVRRVEE